MLISIAPFYSRRKFMPLLAKEEYVEQAHLFHAMNNRLSADQPIQELLHQVRHEVLATTNLPKAIDFLLGELNHLGQMTKAMSRLSHYFTPFQTFLVSMAEHETGRFDMRMAAMILEHEARFRSEGANSIAMFLFQFEALCRNRLSYDHGLSAMSQDPIYDKNWATWILQIRHQIGIVDIADLVYVQSQHYVDELKRMGRDDSERPASILFGAGEGRIALANRGKEPLYLFSAFQRQLGYPAVPRPEKVIAREEMVDKLERVVGRLEVRIKLLEDEQRERGIDLSQFFQDSKRKNT